MIKRFVNFGYSIVLIIKLKNNQYSFYQLKIIIIFALAKLTSDENRECYFRKNLKFKRWNL